MTKNNAGFTLLELIVAIAIIGILTSLAGFSYHNWMDKYKTESQIKEMYADFMNMRLRAMYRGRVHFVKLEDKKYIIYEDTHPAPDGNNTLDATDAKIIEKNTAYAITHALGGGHPKFSLDRDGTSTLNGRIGLLSDASSEYDCIVLYSTRINLGKWDDKGTASTADDECIPK